MLGRTEPRLCTPPLRELTPETSAGFAQIRFARDVLRHPLDPWQEFAVIHAGELLEDRSPRFRIVLLLVSRQQGKTELLAVLPAYWMAVDASPMVLGLSTKVEYAKETWAKTLKLIEAAPALNAERDRHWFVEGNNRIEQWLSNGSRYKISASNAEGGRSLTVRNLMFDEFRHTSHVAWDAAEPTTSSVFDAQIWCTSNAGDDRSHLLNEMRDAAVKFIETGEGDDSVLLMEWSAPEDADPTDLEALAQAMPNLGRRTRADRILAKARAAVEAGGEMLTTFKTNYMCQRVRIQNPAIDPAQWKRCYAAGVEPTGKEVRRALCLDVSPDGGHVTLAAAVVLADTGAVLVGIVGAWPSTAEARLALPGILRKTKTKTLGWFPSGPAAQIAADLADRSTARRSNRALPASVKSEEIRGEVAAVCMGLEELTRSGLLVHAGDPMLDEQVYAAERFKVADGLWRFARSGETYVDAVYAIAGAAHIARTMPAPATYRRLVAVEDAD